MVSQDISSTDFFLSSADAGEASDIVEIKKMTDESFSSKGLKNIPILGTGLSEDVLNPIVRQLSVLSPKLRFVLIENNYDIALENLKAVNVDIETGQNNSYVFGHQTKLLVINLGLNPDAQAVLEFLNGFKPAAEIEELYLIFESVKSTPSEPKMRAEIKLPFAVLGADRTSPEVSPIAEMLINDYPNIERLKINNDYEVTYAHIHLMDQAAVVDPQNRFIYSFADGLLALNLHAFSEGQTILSWLKDFPHKEQIFEVQLNSLDERERKLEKISEMLRSFDEMKHFNPGFMEQMNIRKIAEYILDNPDCYDLRVKANLEALRFIKLEK